MIGLAILLALGYALFWLSCVLFTAWMLTHPPRRTYASAIARDRPGDPSELPAPRPFRSWTLRADARDLPVWEISGDEPRGPIAILTHGWGDSRIGALARLDALLPHCSIAIAWDLPGHGEAPGFCRLGTREVRALDALIDHLCPPGSPARILLHGWSLGAGLSIIAAAHDPRIIAVIAEAPYRLAQTPARNFLRARGIPHLTTLAPALWLLHALGPARGVLPRRAFDRAAHATDLPVPLLVIHGELDAVCPVEDGRAIAAAAADSRLAVLPRAGHNNLWADPFLDDSRRAVREFLLRLRHDSPALSAS